MGCDIPATYCMCMPFPLHICVCPTPFHVRAQVVPDQLVFGDGRIIGRGACSVVNLARHKDTGQLFAVKVFSLLDREKRRQLDREIGTLLRSLENG